VTFLNTFLEVGPLEPSDIVALAIIVFSIILFALAITAYKNNRVKRMGFAAAAFALFAVQLILGYVDDAFDYVNTEGLDLISSAITLSILLLFFFAIVIKKKTQT
jgi:hypothetical protein